MTRVNYEGKEYELINEAYFDDICGKPAGIAEAVCMTDIADGEGWQKAYRVVWEYHEAEDGGDCCDWETPLLVEPCGEYNVGEKRFA